MNKTLRGLFDEFDVKVRLAHLPEFEISICGLCGNHGKITITVPAPPCGFAPGFVPPKLDHFCVCPNGRTMKKVHDREAKKRAP